MARLVDLTESDKVYRVPTNPPEPKGRPVMLRILGILILLALCVSASFLMVWGAIAQQFAK